MTMKLVVVLVRNLAARWLGAYGNEWVATPHLDRLAAEGIVFERHIADRIDGRCESYAGPVVRFDDLVPPWDVPRDIFNAYAEEYEGMEPVREPGPDADEDALRCSYAAVLTRLDAKLGRIFDDGRRSGAAIVVTSDLGFPLGEHGLVGPAESAAHVELVQLPLIVQLPGGEAVREEQFTQPEAFFSMLDKAFARLNEENSDASGLPAIRATFRAAGQDEALTRSVSGRVVAARTAAWTVLDSDVKDGSMERCVKVYRMPEDAGEHLDLADRWPDVAEAFSARFRRADDYSDAKK